MGKRGEKDGTQNVGGVNGREGKGQVGEDKKERKGERGKKERGEEVNKEWKKRKRGR